MAGLHVRPCVTSLVTPNLAAVVRVAIIHDAVVGMRRDKQVLEALMKLHPEADIFTDIVAPQVFHEALHQHNSVTSIRAEFL
ncbi:glycosyltransferase family 4 protein [Methylobacterium sp. WL64]|uniref:glycosyltransferase family 4 protein n=1 Tax=Methylobacterium sp. WL64 TaxID=2603894 RepID=UPI0011CB9737|nr:glycosyltransferase family 4 protein [Methylobacterium sp. WL64]TXM99297.1 glycosyltransferase family 4 protein [Methylobacterium sp. WL64]